MCNSGRGIAPLPDFNRRCHMADNVNHPAHYETGKFECIDVMVETQGVEATKDFCVICLGVTAVSAGSQ